MKNFLSHPFSNGGGLIVAALLALVLLLRASPATPLVPLSLSGSASNFSTVQVDNGTVAAPSLSFTSDTSNGLYRVGSNDIGVAAGGTKILDVSSSGLTVASGGIVMLATASQVIPGATSFSVRDTANANDNLLVSNAGALTVRNGLTVSAGALSLPTAAVTSAMINDISRSVELPILAWHDCTTPLALSWTDGADAKPAFAKVNGSPVIAYDATGGSVDTDLICTSFIVPQDFVGGGQFNVRVTQGGATGANIESASCTVGIDGAAQGSAGVTNLVNQVAVQSVSVQPVGTFAVGAAVGVNCKQGNATADDTVNILSIEFQYTATE